MPKRRYEDFACGGHMFRFLYDKDQPNILHVEASHELCAEDAIDVFFDGQNSTQERTDLEGSDGSSTFETLYKNRGIWWKWIDKDKKHVLIWSLFRRYNNW